MMLWLYKYDANYNIDKWLHLEYARWLSGHGYKIIAYGKGVHQAYPDLAPVPWEPDLTLEALVKQFKIDLIILNTKSRMFDHYSPFTKEAIGCWLPKDFASFNRVPKVMIEEDFHYEDDDNWYSEQGISLILQRHCSQVKRGKTVKHRWLPFSVDMDIFGVESKYPRIDKLGFIGSASSAYPERLAASQLLLENAMLDDFTPKRIVDNLYVDYLKRYVGFLSGASKFDIVAAKNFEIAASGAVLFTNHFSGLEQLFPSDAYCLWNLNNVVKQADKVITDKDYARRVAYNGRKACREHHTHATRTNEMFEILRREL